MIKVFPARQVEAQYLRDILAPLPHLRLVPTGGINARNIGEYLQAGAVAVGLGGNLVGSVAKIFKPINQLYYCNATDKSAVTGHLASFNPR